MIVGFNFSGKRMENLHLCRRSSAALRLMSPPLQQSMAITYPVNRQNMTMRMVIEVTASDIAPWFK